jgi:localization factor PodJL
LFTVFLKSPIEDIGSRPPHCLLTNIGSKQDASCSSRCGLDARMSSGSVWNLRGLRPEARDAARRSGMSVGEWLNSVIRSDHDADFGPPSKINDINRKAGRWRREHDEIDQEPTWRGGPYREEQRRGRRRHARWNRPREDNNEAVREASRARKEIGGVNARLDALSRQIARMARDHSDPPPQDKAMDRAADRAADHAVPGNEADPRGLSIDDAVAEITAHQRVLEGGEPQSRDENPEAEATAIDISGLDRQLRQITARLETLRPTSDLERAIIALRGDLSEIGQLVTEALPRRAVESLEIEIKTLGQRIDQSRQAGADTTALATIDRGLADVRDELRKLSAAENLVGAEEAIKSLSQKIDLSVAKEDPATLQQLETAIGGLRSVVSHVASGDALNKVAEDVRNLAGKVDGLANSTVTDRAIAVLEKRIDTLASALNASTEAGQAVPRELETLLGGLIEKLEWVQLTHTDHAALAHLEDRIATLVKRLDASDARLSQLDGIERGLADLLMHLQEIRGGNGRAEGGGKVQPAGAVEQRVAENRRTEQRTLDSLEAVHGPVERVVDRPATIERDMRTEKVAIKPTASVDLPPQAPATPSSMAAALPAAPMQPPLAAPAGQAAFGLATTEPGSLRSTPARAPIDPDLPPDHPLEPRSTGVRSRPPASPAERVAASEAAIGKKPPVIPDPGGKPDFIAAARRAARTAALATAEEPASSEIAKSDAAPAKKSQRLRTLIVAAAVVVIVLGGLRIASRLLDDGASNVQPQQPQHLQSQHHGEETPARPVGAAESIVPEPPAPETIPAQNQGGEAPIRATPGGANAVPAASPTDARAKGQSLNETSEPPAAAAAAGLGGAATVANTAAFWPDYTGSLPNSALPHTAAPASEELGDKLPATIGGPALRAAAFAGNAAAAYEVATRFAEGRGVAPNAEEAARWFDRAAKMGFVPAQFRLGSLYEKGAGVKKDLHKARDLYRAAADKGHGKAMHNLAALYAEGIDGAADYRTAAQWFHKAADRGLTDSQYNLGILYARGIGVEKNFAESYKWFALAAKRGDADAAKKRDEVGTHLDPRSLAAARQAVETWRPEPQPPDAISVKIPAAWAMPASAAATPRTKVRPAAAKASAADAKVN